MVLVEELEQTEVEEVAYLLEIETKGGGDNLMPVYKCPNGKYRIGSGPCDFGSKEKAEVAYQAYLAKKHNKKDSKKESIVIQTNLQGLDGLQKEIDKEIDRLWDLSSVLSSIKRVVEYFSKNGVKG